MEPDIYRERALDELAAMAVKRMAHKITRDLVDTYKGEYHTEYRLTVFVLTQDEALKLIRDMKLMRAPE
jgi:hypothetical protein